MTKALAVSVHLFHFMHVDRKSLSHNESSKCNTPILSGTKYVIVAKSNPPLRRNLKGRIFKSSSRRIKVTMVCGQVLTNILNTNVAHWLVMPFLPIFTMQWVELKHI